MRISPTQTVADPGLQLETIAHLTEALERMIQNLTFPVPRSISIFFDGTEVYLYRSSDGRVLWWGAPDGSDLDSTSTPIPSTSSQ